MTEAKIACIAAQFNPSIVDVMVASALDELALGPERWHDVVRVPGCYEAPFVAELLLARGDVSALVVLGHIERGETLHGEVMGHVVCTALVDMSLRHRKPIGIGIIGPGATVAQAERRRDDSARAAVRAVRALLRLAG